MNHLLTIILFSLVALLCSMGVHSGPVTGGVLRGQNARFQLFGDTMNMAARLESTGVRSRIHISSATASLLIQAGKGKWLERRREMVEIKGKGKVETYFLKVQSTDTSTSGNSGSEEDKALELFKSPALRLSGHDSQSLNLSGKKSRLVDWNTEVLTRRIKAIIQYREASVNTDLQNIEIDPIVTLQLQKFITFVVSSYRDNPFHNYEVRVNCQRAEYGPPSHTSPAFSQQKCV
jgi:hypothetical protein